MLRPDLHVLWHTYYIHVPAHKPALHETCELSLSDSSLISPLTFVLAEASLLQ